MSTPLQADKKGWIVFDQWREREKEKRCISLEKHIAPLYPDIQTPTHSSIHLHTHAYIYVPSSYRHIHIYRYTHTYTPTSRGCTHWGMYSRRRRQLDEFKEREIDLNEKDRLTPQLIVLLKRPPDVGVWRIVPCLHLCILYYMHAPLDDVHTSALLHKAVRSLTCVPLTDKQSFLFFTWYFPRQSTNRSRSWDR